MKLKPIKSGLKKFRTFTARWDWILKSSGNISFL